LERWPAGIWLRYEEATSASADRPTPRTQEMRRT